MGSALLARWRAAGIEDVAVIDPAIPGAVMPGGAPDIVVLAVKPQLWRAATAGMTLAAGTLVVSVMAGVAIADLAAVFGGAVIVRAMPNTPAAIGQGVTALFTDDAAGDGPAALARAAAEVLFQPAGATLWLEHEADFDAVTAVSGSGPGYVFAFIEALAAAGTAAGLDPGLAARLARATVTGAAALAAAEATPVAALRERVTSPAGTTAAGLAVLVPGLTPLLTATVAAAAARSRALGAGEAGRAPGEVRG